MLIHFIPISVIVGKKRNRNNIGLESELPTKSKVVREKVQGKENKEELCFVVKEGTFLDYHT